MISTWLSQRKYRVLGTTSSYPIQSWITSQCHGDPLTQEKPMGITDVIMVVKKVQQYY